MIDEELLQRANDGDFDAIVDVGNAYFFGRGVEEDNDAAGIWFRKAYDLQPDNPRALSQIAKTEKTTEEIKSLKAIIKELSEKKENFQFSVRGLALSLFVHIVNAYKADPKSQKEIKSTVLDDNGLVIAPALDYIRNNYSHEFPIDSLADMCGLSPTHFRRVFQSIMNTSPLEYLNNFRIDKASILLRSTELPVLTISEEVGFRSVSSFNRHFQENTGTSPLKWRKQMSYIDNKSLLKYTGWLVPDK